MRHIWALVVAVFGTALMLPLLNHVAAQDALVAATPAATPVAIPCTVEPRPTDEVLALWFGPDGVPVGTPGVIGPVVSEAAVPQGKPVDPTTLVVIDATAREFFACLETDQNTRAFALITDDLLRLFVPESDPLQPITSARISEYRQYLEAQRLVTPAPGTDQLVVPPVQGVRMLEDGRIGAILIAEEGALFLYLERQDNRWLVDAFDLVDPVGTPEAKP